MQVWLPGETARLMGSLTPTPGRRRISLASGRPLHPCSPVLAAIADSCLGARSGRAFRLILPSLCDHSRSACGAGIGSTRARTASAQLAVLATTPRTIPSRHPTLKSTSIGLSRVLHVPLCMYPAPLWQQCAPSVVVHEPLLLSPSRLHTAPRKEGPCCSSTPLARHSAGQLTPNPLCPTHL